MHYYIIELGWLWLLQYKLLKTERSLVYNLAFIFLKISIPKYFRNSHICCRIHFVELELIKLLAESSSVLHSLKTCTETFPLSLCIILSVHSVFSCCSLQNGIRKQMRHLKSWLSYAENSMCIWWIRHWKSNFKKKPPTCNANMARKIGNTILILGCTFKSLHFFYLYFFFFNIKMIPWIRRRKTKIV